MRNAVAYLAVLAGTCASQTVDSWLLPNFAQRLELEVSDASPQPATTLVVVPVPEVAATALRFPGTLAIAVLGGTREVLPSQADDLNGDGNPDEFVFPLQLNGNTSRTVHIYYSTTLRDTIPYPKRVHASHAFGYNRATAALESEQVGYRTYGGFFLDIQARMAGASGLHNSLVGYFGSRSPSPAGLDIIHLGDTLGLGGLFLRKGDHVYRPPLNVPDYAHKASPRDVPQYRVIADGPVRAVVEAWMDQWQIGNDRVDLRARYSIAANGNYVECNFQIVPLRMSTEYEVGAGIRHLPEMNVDRSKGRLALSGAQNAKVGPLGLAIYFDPAEAEIHQPLATKEAKNEIIVFRNRLAGGRAIRGRYWIAGAWSGSGVGDLLPYLARVHQQATVTFHPGKYRFARTPNPERVEGEAY